MKIKIGLIITLLIQITYISAQTKSELKIYPKKTVDIGIFSNDYNKIYTQVFKLKNVSKDTIKILDIFTSCTCLDFEIKVKNILPLDTVKAVMKVDVSNKIRKFSTYTTLITDTHQKYYKLKLIGYKKIE